MKLKLTLSILFLFAFAVSAYAQSVRPRENTPEIPKETEAASAPRIPFQSRLFEIKHRDPKEIASAVQGLATWVGAVQYNEKLKTLTVQDYPENIIAIEAALKRLDVLENAQESFEIQLHVLTTTALDTKGSVPADLEPVIAQLRKTLKYPGYNYITTFTSRVQNGGAFSGNGFAPNIVRVANRNISSDTYSYKLGKIRLATNGDGKETLQISQFNFTVSVLGNDALLREIGINTSINLREGENVVVGTTSVGENALIVVVSAKKIN